jgi:hypothetical protein
MFTGTAVSEIEMVFLEHRSGGGVMLRNFSKWCFVLPLTILWILSPIWLASGMAVERHGVRKVYKHAELVKKVEETLTFRVHDEGRRVSVRGLLTDETAVQTGKLDQEIAEEAFEPGSLWTIALAYPREQEGVPVILQMRRERGKLPE